jgi:ADP-ribosyl-[dinitrogen reductase] hydrolase
VKPSSDPRRAAREDWLLAMAVGDAACISTEFVKPDDPVVVQTLTTLDMGRFVGSTALELPPGQYTDDTQMTIAVAESLLECHMDTPGLANAVVRVFQRDRRVGYARGFQSVLATVSDGQELMTRLYGRNNSEKNGAAMRAIPYGLLGYAVDATAVHAQLGAKLTHDSLSGVWSSMAVAMLASMAKAGRDRTTFAGELRRRMLMVTGDTHRFGPVHDPLRWLCEPYYGRVEGGGADSDSLAWLTVRAVLRVVQEAKSIRNAIELTIKQGGDTDTVGALSCGILALTGMPLDPWMIEQIEDGRFGRDYLRALGARMLGATNG